MEYGLCPAAVWCSHWDSKLQCCKAFAIIDGVSPVIYKWRSRPCPMQREPKELTPEEMRKAFAGKRTNLAAIYGAVGYKFGVEVTNPSRTPGKTKGNLCVTKGYLPRFFARRNRSYKHPDYHKWCESVNKLHKFPKLWGE